jgi:enamine deaminase RidA (YjgF/YER057c/UK114 family)
MFYKVNRICSFLFKLYFFPKHKNMSAEEILNKLGLKLPPAPLPRGVYKPCLIDGNHLYLSGHGPVREDKSLIIGRIGSELNIEEGKLAARQVGLTMLSTIKNHIGSLDRIKRVIKVLGMVNCTPDFQRHPYVINGCSELFAEIWGEDNGVGVRSIIWIALVAGVKRETAIGGQQGWVTFQRWLTLVRIIGKRKT